MFTPVLQFVFLAIDVTFKYESTVIYAPPDEIFKCKPQMVHTGMNMLNIVIYQQIETCFLYFLKQGGMAAEF